MIVESMTHAEVFRELDRDRDNVRRWFDHRADEYRRRALRTQHFPAIWWLDYTSPRRVHYLLSIYCSRRRWDGYNGIITLALRRERHGHTVYLSWLYNVNTIRKMVYLPHVFDRYAERTGVQKTGLDLVRHIFGDIGCGYTLDTQQLAAKSVRYNGRDHRFMAIKDGILLGEEVNGIFIMRTFITYDMAGGLQRQQFDYARTRVLDTSVAIQDVKRHFLIMNGIKI